MRHGPGPGNNQDLARKFSNHFPGLDITHKEAWGQIVPAQDEEAALAGFEPLLKQIMPEAHPEKRRGLANQIEEYIDTNLALFESYYAAGFALEAGRAAHAPNAVASLMPYFGSGIAVGTPGTAYDMYVSVGGTVSVGNPFTFFRKQTFHRIMTSKVDADAGWFFVGNTVKFIDDPIAGMFYDTSFSAFEPEIPFDRTPLGAYERRTFFRDTTIQFNAQCFINPNSPAAEMVSGLMLQYRDDRCNLADDGLLEGLPNGNTLVEVVNHLMGQRVAAHRGGGHGFRGHRTSLGAR